MIKELLEKALTNPKILDKESIIALQKIDCNCNDCKFMTRDFEKKKFWDESELHKNSKNASHRIHYGDCTHFNKKVSFIPNVCQLDTQKCFAHRREGT